MMSARFLKNDNRINIQSLKEQIIKTFLIDTMGLSKNNKYFEKYYQILNQKNIVHLNDTQLENILIKSENCQCDDVDGTFMYFCCGDDCGMILCENCTREDRISHQNGLQLICQECVELEEEEMVQQDWIDNAPGNESSPEYADKTPPPDQTNIFCCDTVGCGVLEDWGIFTLNKWHGLCMRKN